MMLKIKRSQRQGGMLGGKAIFALDIRADYTQEERDAINRYKLGGEIVYSSEAAKRHAETASAHLQSGTAAGLAKGLMSMALASSKLTVTIASLQQGHHVECKDMSELLEAENVLREASKNLTSWLDAAKSFDGREIVVQYESGEEKVHNPGSPVMAA